MDNWPLALQQKLNSDDFSQKFGVTTLRTDMDVGPAKVRSRFTDAVDLYSASVLMTFADYSILSDFFKTTLNNGALPFIFPDPISGDDAIFRFVTPPVITALGGITFKVALDWEKIG